MKPPKDLTNPIHAYRHLLRETMAAVSHAYPARIIARDALRTAFRDRGAAPLEAERVKRTLWFLTAAAKERGLEHQIVKNMVAVRRGRMPRPELSFDTLHKAQRHRAEFQEHKRSAYHHYEMTIAMLNETMGLCLPLK